MFPLLHPTIVALTTQRTGCKGDDRVILNERGDLQVSPSNWFEPAVRRAGLKGFTRHCLRNTFASRLVMAGVDLRTVRELMGHETIQMIVSYAYLPHGHQLAVVEHLAAAAVAVSEPTATRTATGHLGRSVKGSRNPG